MSKYVIEFRCNDAWHLVASIMTKKQALAYAKRLVEDKFPVRFRPVGKVTKINA